MTRFLVILALLVLIGLSIDRGFDRLIAKLRGGMGPRQGPAGSQTGPPTAVTETLVRCSRCGVFVLQTRTVKDGQGRVFCSERCRSG